MKQSFELKHKHISQSQHHIHKQQSLQQKYLNASFSQIRQKDRYIDEPRQLPTKSYSLAPDIATGWKPKKKYAKINYQNVFPLNFANNVIDLILKTLSYRKNLKYSLVYVGPRKNNSFQLHEHRNYENPYPLEKRMQTIIVDKQLFHKNIRIQQCDFSFQSDFQSGNLDAAIKVNQNEFDLFMRVDTNTKGHTNWYYFQIKNKEYKGPVKFNICNFRRFMSLYQRGMKPYVFSEKRNSEWVQAGYDISYTKKPLRYEFLYDQQQQLSQSQD